MHCPYCGAESTQGLNYCKRCGNSLALTPSGPPSLKLSGMYWAIAIITVAGLALLSGTILGMVGMGLRDEDSIIPVILFGCLTIFGVDAMLIRQLSRVIGMSERSDSVLPKRPPPANPTPPRINAPPIVMSSVTEHTTRRFAGSRGEQSDESE